MKKIANLIYLLVFGLSILFLAIPSKSLAGAMSISTNPASAKVGDKVTFTINIGSAPAEAYYVEMYISDITKDASGIITHNFVLKRTYSFQTAPATFTYEWDTSGSVDGTHQYYALLTKSNHDRLDGTDIKTYSLSSAAPAGGTPTPSNSASGGAGGTPSPTNSGNADATKSLFPSNPEKWTLETIFEIINNILTYVSLTAGALAVFMIVWFGFSYFTAFGSEEKIEGAKKGILYTLSGLGVIILAKVLVAFLFSIFQ